ncbi:phosphotransferase [Actinoplanes sp. NBRC 103695]|uniref:phosphotransferase n=1 Tax=Actinoplanes sp. NBRC 103695 TaxID=3032202 RepID=UPI0024A13B6F|nr:phosphotransferase [Actinoplanes sp. NBRC 103695]GLZ00755.1 phosphotransferase [Actinoplanes sp. NBRC 103695]
MDEGRWRDPEWLRRAYAWIDARVERTGEIEQPHVRAWATVMRVPTSGGDVWFKANDASLRHEVAVAERIGVRRPDVVPPLIGADAALGWMLMADAGETLRSVSARERSLDRWLDVLPRYASVQLDLAGDVDDLLAAGVPDMRLGTLPAAYLELLDEVGAEQRFRDAVPVVEALCDRLSAYGIPELLQHDDLHDGQVFVKDGRHLVLDWGDACVSHPFFSLAVTVQGGLAWGLDDVEDSVDTAPFLDAYLEPFGPPADLLPAAELAMRLGWVCRAINGRVPGDDASTVTRLRMFLDGHP